MSLSCLVFEGDRLPFAVLHLHGLQTQIAYFIFLGESARRRDRTEAVFVGRLKRVDQLVGGEIVAGALDRIGQHIDVGIGQQVEGIGPAGGQVRIFLLPFCEPRLHFRVGRGRQQRDQGNPPVLFRRLLGGRKQALIDHVGADEKRLVHPEFFAWRMAIAASADCRRLPSLADWRPGSPEAAA